MYVAIFSSKTVPKSMKLVNEKVKKRLDFVEFHKARVLAEAASREFSEQDTEAYEKLRGQLSLPELFLFQTFAEYQASKSGSFETPNVSEGESDASSTKSEVCDNNFLLIFSPCFVSNF
jgi:hypothetical protein